MLEGKQSNKVLSKPLPKERFFVIYSKRGKSKYSIIAEYSRKNKKT